MNLSNRASRTSSIRSAVPDRFPSASRFGLALAATALVLSACVSGGAPNASPSGAVPSSGLPTPTPSAVLTPEAAVARVLALDPRFAGLRPSDPAAIGQCCSYTVTPNATGFDVIVEIGWGDCPAGCISRHHWFYAVATDGTVHLEREDGPIVPAGIPAAGSGAPPAGVIGIRGVASAGPVCPVARPGDSACADRPVAGATIHVIDATGTEVATLVTDTAGAFVVTLAPGRYRVQPDPVSGLMGTAQAVEVTVGTTLADVQLSYDTGIR